MRIVVLLSCLSAALAFTPGRLPWERQYGSLIVGGYEAPVGSRPYQVAVFWEDGAGNLIHNCGGTLVHRNWIVSAAHCKGTNEVTVGLGYHSLSAGGEQVLQGKWIVHPNYNPNTVDNDVALIKLSTPAALTDNVKTIGIASAGTDVADGTRLLVSGWGALSSGGGFPDKLQQVVVKGVSRSECNKSSSYGGGITDNMFCAADQGKDACQNDSGGPIVSHFDETKHVAGVTLQGIVSWGAGCADPSYPGVYARAANYCAWFAAESSNEVSC